MGTSTELLAVALNFFAEVMTQEFACTTGHGLCRKVYHL